MYFLEEIMILSGGEELKTHFHWHLAGLLQYALPELQLVQNLAVCVYTDLG